MLAAKRHRPTALTKHGFKRVAGYSLEIDGQARAFDGRLLIGIDPIMPCANKSGSHCKRSTEIADSGTSQGGSTSWPSTWLEHDSNDPQKAECPALDLRGGTGYGRRGQHLDRVLRGSC